MAEFSHSVRVYFEDTDAGGIVYYANYLKFCERARTEWLRSHGVDQSVLARDCGVFFVVKDTALSYHRSARLDDTLNVTVKVAKLGRVAVVFEQTVRRGEELLVESTTKVGCVDAQHFRPTPIPEQVMRALNPTQ